LRPMWPRPREMLKARSDQADGPTVPMRLLLLLVAVGGAAALDGAATLEAAPVCRLTSVDEAAYVAQNERILRAVPVVPGARLIQDNSVGTPAADRCTQHENGPPYSGFRTWHVYSLRAGANRTAAAGWYAKVLARLGWVYQEGSVATGYLSYNRGTASLAVQLVGQRPLWLQVSADYALIKHH
jgi:hypothetical protein